MKKLVQHLWNCNQEEIIDKSIYNCHVIGLHSIMLLDSPEKRIRLYITNTDHVLYKNKPGNSNQEMSLGIHPHNCDITLLVWNGGVTNIKFNRVVENLYKYYNTFSSIGIFSEYRYVTGIGKDKYYIEKFAETSLLEFVSKDTLYNGDSVFMKAQDLHTIHVDEFLNTAWFVFEGKTDPSYIPRLYSNNRDLHKLEFNEKLYQKMNKHAIEALLKREGLL